MLLKARRKQVHDPGQYTDNIYTAPEVWSFGGNLRQKLAFSTKIIHEHHIASDRHIHFQTVIVCVYLQRIQSLPERGLGDAKFKVPCIVQNHIITLESVKQSQFIKAVSTLGKYFSPLNNLLRSAELAETLTAICKTILMQQCMHGKTMLLGGNDAKSY